MGGTATSQRAERSTGECIQSRVSMRGAYPNSKRSDVREDGRGGPAQQPTGWRGWVRHGGEDQALATGHKEGPIPSPHLLLSLRHRGREEGWFGYSRPKVPVPWEASERELRITSLRPPLLKKIITIQSAKLLNNT